ncbi:hypothetical protein GCM10020358_16660 [Amorphoplanes nipponensis]|uniref:Uncharacterized protein n=1 Tax=Actinoplanes nipponensis TaxID=135950 RepID=A0A919MX74_9ACTN|nr:hypothetical protein [Actinoplanes nipponensis]GIE52970.1 hypothetical protein Ani05nite_65040 [Actinoplanes nipponensis]
MDELPALGASDVRAQLSAAMGEHAARYADGLRRLVGHPQVAVLTVAELTGQPGPRFAAWARDNTDMFR